MRIPVHTQIQEVAGGRRAASAQHRHAALFLTPRLCSPRQPHPNPRAAAAGTYGVPQEDLFFAPLTARFPKRKPVVGKPSATPRNSR
jgi:hypothetical protein